jgi:hypothetical protein
LHASPNYIVKIKTTDFDAGQWAKRTEKDSFKGIALMGINSEIYEGRI